MNSAELVMVTDRPGGERRAPVQEGGERSCLSEEIETATKQKIDKTTSTQFRQFAVSVAY